MGAITKVCTVGYFVFAAAGVALIAMPFMSYVGAWFTVTGMGAVFATFLVWTLMTLRRPHRQKSRHTPIVPARGFWKLLLKLTGAAAITMPWRTIYVMEPYINHQALIAHEKVHIEQIKREGAFRFSVKYLWWLVTRGYYNNPFEREAYERAPLL